MIAQLMPLDGGRAIELRRAFVLVGRHSRCDLRIRHRTVSKVHCVLVNTDGMLFLRDLSSTNGCQVNGRRVTRAALLPNDVVSLANFRFRVQMGPDRSESHGRDRCDRTEVVIEPSGRLSQRPVEHPPKHHRRSKRSRDVLESSLSELFPPAP